MELLLALVVFILPPNLSRSSWQLYRRDKLNLSQFDYQQDKNSQVQH